MSSVILNAFALAYAITDERVLLDKGDAQWSLKGIVGIYVSIPPASLLITICVVMAVFKAGDASLFWSVFIAYWVMIVAVNVWVIGFYHNNIDTIWQLGRELREDPDRGPRWARRRSNAFIYGNAAYLIVLIGILLKNV